jgi:proteasome beta subunit|tara:strand:- start:70924 stop:71727 length:804 start_codon:yes stop_codon:yes gene_type:complete
VTFPLFAPAEDPGPSFVALLARLGMDRPGSDLGPAASQGLDGIAHGTTVLAIRFADGVVMAGDRRATSGHLISHRSIEKVFPADSGSGVAIAGAAGPAMEMVRLFQLQLEHYEKVEGSPLSLEGKANQLTLMLRSHLPVAMMGLPVVPLFAGYDKQQRRGRLFQFDITGGRYEEQDHAATGSGSLHATTVMKLRFNDDLDADSALDLAVEALFQAADEDSATGGPDMVRGIFPVLATITSSGFERLPDEDVASRTSVFLDRLSGGAR